MVTAKRNSLVVVFTRSENSFRWTSKVSERLTAHFSAIAVSGWKLFGDDIKITTLENPDEWTISLNLAREISDGEFRSVAEDLFKAIFFEDEAALLREAGQVDRAEG